MKQIKLFWYNLVTNYPKGIVNWLLLSLLWILSWLYRLIILIRAGLYKSGIIKQIKLSCPVISIGNITVGGTGKTPMIDYLAQQFAQKNKKVVVLSRGYGRVDGGRDDEQLSFDNKSIIRLTGANRAKLGQLACKAYLPDVILLDDGFQHWRIQRDWDIVMIDCLNPFGSRNLFPAGILREDLNALKRASLFILTHCNLVRESDVAKITDYLVGFNKPIIKSIHKPIALINQEQKLVDIPLESLKGKKVESFCGIGNPDSFRSTLGKLGILLSGFSIFPDHYVYNESEISDLVKQAREQKSDYIITTIKDIVKIPHNFIPEITIYALKVELDIIEGKEKLEVISNNVFKGDI